MNNLHTAINASGIANRNGFSLNIWILESWRNQSLKLDAKYKNLATYKNMICLVFATSK